MSGGINFSGLSSGIDSNSIIEQLIAVDRRPEDLMKNDMARLQQKQTAYNAVSAQLLQFQAAALTVNGLRSFDLVTANSSDDASVTVSAQTGSQTGTHTITNVSLAKAQLISSGVQTSQTAPLGTSGQILINGKAINVAAGDSLQTLASNINAVQAGVTASIVSPAANQFYLTLSSSNTGVQGQISISDAGSGNVLNGSLGLFATGGATSLSHAIGSTGAGSDLFADSATSVATLLGETTASTGTVQIAGQNVTLSLNDSLSQIAANINSAGITGVSAQIVTTTDPISKATKQQLQISGTTSFTDSNNVLANLGVVHQTLASGRELQAAQDASFSLDGLPTATRPTNSFSDAISGVTINLIKDNPGATTTINVTSDTDTIKSNINAFVKAFNDSIDAISSLSQYDPSSGKTGPLFGDITTQSITDALTSQVTSGVAGLPSSMSAISQVGITLDQSNHLSVDDTKLSAALASNRQGVATLFRAAGNPTNSSVQFVSSTVNTQTSPTAGYAINITQPAKQATITAGAAQTGNLAQDEMLTFGGTLFGTTASAPLTGRQILLHAGSSLLDVVSQINADSGISAVLSASAVGNKLTLTSKSYGAAAQFAVISSLMAGSSGTSSGIDNSLLVQSGVDVAGTINGETATGSGQFLTGSQQGAGGLGNGRALGLQVRVTATTPGSYGNITFTSGVADQVRNYVTTQTDGFLGALTTASQGLQSSIDDIQSNIDTIEASLTAKQTSLKQQFTAMEVAVAQLKSASAGLAGLGSGSSTTSSSSSSSSSSS